MTLRQRGRALYMSTPVATSAINTNRTKVVGTGLTLKSSVDADVLGMTPEQAAEWQRQTEREFQLWAGNRQNCDALALNDFYELQQLVIVSWLMSGDAFALVKRGRRTKFNPYTFRLHIVEADRISTPYNMHNGVILTTYTEGKNPNTGNEIHDGVEVDSMGRVVAYHICDRYPFQAKAGIPQWTRVLAFGEHTGLPNVCHIMSAERPDQYRGVTYLAQVIEPLIQLRRYTESELMAALIQTFFSAWITTEEASSPDVIEESGVGAIAGVQDGEMPINEQRDYVMGPGTTTELPVGKNIVFGKPNVPQTAFGDFLDALCKIIGAGLGIPKDVLLKEYNSSYSASRGALMDAWDDFRMRRTWLVSDFCQPVYETWLTEAVAAGRVSAPGFFDDPILHAAWCGAKWIGPTYVSLDPTKEANAAILQIQQGIKTREQVTREQGGGDWNANMAQILQENAALAEANRILTPTVPIVEEEEEGENEE